MIAEDFYALACRCYNGSEEARREWFSLLAPLARAAAFPYGVLPGIVLARAACESGWGSDLYEEVMEQKFGVWLKGKAQNHNNLLGMVAYGQNDVYAPGLIIPAWIDYRSTFEDYGPHGDMGGQYRVTIESWKGYELVEDAFEDFCAVIRSQAWRRGETWPEDLRGQLLSMGRGYTPEGAASKTGMTYSWQDTTLTFYEKYNLAQYDERKGGDDMAGPAKMTERNLEKHIVRAFRYAYNSCHYGRTDTHYPPGEPTADGRRVLDCVGLIYRAFWTMGRFPKVRNIDQLQELCLSNGLKKSTDPNDVWRRHGIVCMQDKNNRGTEHINHVFYTYGGKDAGHISKYDLGSEQRMRTWQPFQGVPANEWPDKIFLCMFYVPEPEGPADVPDYDDGEMFVGVISANVGLYAGPGSDYKKLRACKEGERVVYGLRVTNKSGRDWRHATVGGVTGWLYHSAVARTGGMRSYKARIVAGLADGFAACRAGAGTACPEVFRLDCGTEVTVDGTARDAGGTEWLHVYAGLPRRRGYVAAGLVERTGK